MYLACTAIGAFTVAVFLKQLARDLANEARAPEFSLKLARRTGEGLLDCRNLLLVPLTIFNGMEQAFIFGVFTRVGICSEYSVDHIIVHCYDCGFRHS